MLEAWTDQIAQSQFFLQPFCGQPGLFISGLGWGEVGQAWLSKFRQLAGGGGYVSMVTMGVERSWGRVYLALWALLSWLICLSCFSACIEVFIAWGPTCAHDWSPGWPLLTEMPLYYSFR